MSETYLTFTNQTDAQAAADKIWCNQILSYANNEEKLVGDGAGNDYFLSEVQAMTQAQICALKIYGKKDGVIQNTDGLTNKYSNVFIANNDPNVFFFVQPDASLMTGVVNYTEASKNIWWWKVPWDASSNTPTLADGTGTSGDQAIVETAGTQNLGSGDITFAYGDLVTYNGTIWEKSV